MKKLSSLSDLADIKSGLLKEENQSTKKSIFTTKDIEEKEIGYQNSKDINQDMIEEIEESAGIFQDMVKQIVANEFYEFYEFYQNSKHE